MAYRVTIRETATGKETIVFPRSRKTTLFPSMAACQKALDRLSRKIGDGFVGRIYDAATDASLWPTVSKAGIAETAVWAEQHPVRFATSRVDWEPRPLA